MNFVVFIWDFEPNFNSALLTRFWPSPVSFLLINEFYLPHKSVSNMNDWNEWIHLTTVGVPGQNQVDFLTQFWVSEYNLGCIGLMSK